LVVNRFVVFGQKLLNGGKHNATACHFQQFFQMFSVFGLHGLLSQELNR